MAICDLVGKDGSLHAKIVARLVSLARTIAVIEKFVVFVLSFYFMKFLLPVYATGVL
jgi:hypothetical protein